MTPVVSLPHIADSSDVVFIRSSCRSEEVKDERRRVNGVPNVRTMLKLVRLDGKQFRDVEK